jgi:TonB family protein
MSIRLWAPTSSFLRVGLVPLFLGGILLAQGSPGMRSDQTTGQSRETIYKAGKDGVTAPRAIYAPPAEFSEQARRAKYQGVATLRAVVSSAGTVADVSVIGGAGMGLDEKALEAVRRWKFKPATKDGKPVAVEVAVQVSFTLPK